MHDTVHAKYSSVRGFVSVGCCLVLWLLKWLVVVNDDVRVARMGGG